MSRLIGLVKPLSGYMLLAVLQGVTGFLCAISITVLVAMALLKAAGVDGGINLTPTFISIGVFALLRGILHYGEQACNAGTGGRRCAESRNPRFHYDASQGL